MSTYPTINEVDLLIGTKQPKMRGEWYRNDLYLIRDTVIGRICVKRVHRGKGLGHRIESVTIYWDPTFSNFIPPHKPTDRIRMSDQATANHEVRYILRNYIEEALGEKQARIDRITAGKRYTNRQCCAVFAIPGDRSSLILLPEHAEIRVVDKSDTTVKFAMTGPRTAAKLVTSKHEVSRSAFETLVESFSIQELKAA